MTETINKLETLDNLVSACASLMQLKEGLVSKMEEGDVSLQLQYDLFTVITALDEADKKIKRLVIKDAKELLNEAIEVGKEAEENEEK